MAATSETKSTKNLVPPENTVWQKYSSRYEFPYAAVGSFFLHAFVLGLMVMIGLSWLVLPGFQPRPPVSLGVVEVEGGTADGNPEGGGVIENPDGKEPPKNTEIVPNSPVVGAAKTISTEPMPMNEPTLMPGEDLASELIDPSIRAEFDKLKSNADLIANQKVEEKKLPTAVVAKPGGTAPPKGTGGKGLAGAGTGSGNKKGPGTGTGGTPGGATKQQIFARRWRFDLSGNAAEHAEKLAAIGVTLAYSDAGNNLRLISDLRQRPVKTSKEPFSKYKDAVTWYNTDDRSVKALAHELKLSGTPRMIAMLLPKEREEKMADAEAKFAKEKGRDLATVQGTWFDFRLMNGVLEPVVLRME